MLSLNNILPGYSDSRKLTAVSSVYIVVKTASRDSSFQVTSRSIAAAIGRSGVRVRLLALINGIASGNTTVFPLTSTFMLFAKVDVAAVAAAAVDFAAAVVAAAAEFFSAVVDVAADFAVVVVSTVKFAAAVVAAFDEAVVVDVIAPIIINNIKTNTKTIKYTIFFMNTILCRHFLQSSMYHVNVYMIFIMFEVYYILKRSAWDMNNFVCRTAATAVALALAPPAK